MKRKIIAILLCISMIIPAAVPAFAFDEEDVDGFYSDEGGFFDEEDVDDYNDGGAFDEEDVDQGESDGEQQVDSAGEQQVDGQENDEPGTNDSTPENTGDDNKEKEPEEVKTVRKLSVTNGAISFGEIEVGEEVRPISFSVVNEGNVPSLIKWIQADAASAFGIDVLSDVNAAVQPGEKADFSVYLQNADTPEGDYSSTITFQDADDPSVLTTVSATVRIKKKKEEEKEPEGKNTEENTDGTRIEEPKDEDKKDPSEDEKKTSSSSSEPQKVPSQDNKDQGSKTSNEEKGSNGRFMISATCSPRDGGYVSGTGVFKRGGSTVLTVHVEDGYTFNGWYLDGYFVSKKRSISLYDIDEDADFVADLDESDYEIVVKTDNKDYGKVYGGGWFDKGDDAKIEAEPKDGYVFEGWYEKDKLVSREKVFRVKNIKKDHKFKAVFKPGKHSVSIAAYPSEGGKVSGSGKYNDGADVKLTAKANSGYMFKGFMLNNQIISTAEIYTVQKVDRDLSFTAYFEKEAAKTYKITSGVANAGGIITPSGEVKVNEKGKMTFVIAPDNGYGILAVAIDGKQVNVKTTYTFTDVKKDHTISVAFAPKKDSVKQVKMDKIITVEEANAIAVAKLSKASATDEGRSSKVITPEMYAKMKSEGTLEEALKIPEQNVVGMDNTQSLPKEVDSYSYDNAVGVYQALDVSPEFAKRMIESGDDRVLLSTAYDEEYLKILVNNQYLVPGRESETDDIFEDKQTINNMFEFVSGILTNDEKLYLLDGNKVIVSLSIAPYDDVDEETKKAMEKAGVSIDEYFYMVVMKQTDGEPEIVKQLNKPIEVVLKAPKDGSDCVVRLHDGECDVLEDIDNDPATVTVRTDRFSPYAFASKGKEKAAALAEEEIKVEPVVTAAGSNLSKAEEKKAGNGSMMLIFAGAFIALAAVTGIAISGSKKKKRR